MWLTNLILDQLQFCGILSMCINIGPFSTITLHSLVSKMVQSSLIRYIPYSFLLTDSCELNKHLHLIHFTERGIDSLCLIFQAF